MVPVDRSFLERIGIILKQMEDEIMKYQDTRRAPNVVMTRSVMEIS